MVDFDRILCPTDLSDASVRPLTYAAALARWYGAQLTVLHVVPSFDPMPLRSASLDGAIQLIYPASREEVMGELRRVVESTGAAAAAPVLAVEAGDPFRIIVGKARETAANLVVMGTHGRGGFERFLVGSVAEKVLRRAPCPVLTVPPHMPLSRAGDVRLTNILCPMDFSPSALQAFGFAIDLARQGSGSVTLLHVVEWLTEEEPRAEAHFNVPEYRQHLIADAHERVHALVAEEASRPTAVQHVVLPGRPHRAILHVAEKIAADLIVMGAQGRGGVGLALFGSTAQQVVRTAECPVLTVGGPDLPAAS